MGKLEKLTPEQEALLPIVRDYWVNMALHNGKCVQYGDVIEYITTMYKSFGFKKPIIIISDSYLVHKLAINVILSSLRVRNRTAEQVGEQVENQVWNQVGEQLWDEVESQVREQVWDKVESQVREEVWHKVMHRVRNQVRDEVESQVREQVRDRVDSKMTVDPRVFKIEQYFGLGFNFWLGFHDFFSRIGIVKNKIFDDYCKYISQIWEVIYFTNTVFICRLPTKVIKNERGMLHSLTEAAVQWADGLNNYFIDGVGFNKTAWEQLIKRYLSPWEIISMPNLEQRTVALKLYGYDNLIQELKGVVLDKAVLRGRDYEVIRLPLHDDGNSDARFVSVSCPSTKKKAVLRVPPISQTLTCAGAVAWTFGFEEKDYRPIVET